MADEAVAISDDEKWQVESDVRTLKEAELIRADEGRHKKAMTLMGKEIEAMKASMENTARKRFPNTNFKEEN